MVHGYEKQVAELQLQFVSLIIYLNQRNFHGKELLTRDI